MSSARYELDDSIESRLNVSTFEDKFDLKDFVGAVSEGLIARSQDDSGPFDPKPFIQTFETVVDRLISIRRDLQKRTETMEKSVKAGEREFSSKIVQLNSNFDEVGKSFSGMESKISEVGRTAIRIGEQLESVHVARQRAQVAHDLVDYYVQFSRDDTSKLEALRKDGGKEGRAKVATILRRLSSTAREVDIPIADKTRENIDKYCEKFEKEMLRLFDRSYRKGDPGMMAHCAKVLLEFNGGASCVQIYVNQHTFFISKSDVTDPEAVENSPIWDSLPDPDLTPPTREPGLTALYAEIRTTVGQEAKIVEHVFPNPHIVIQNFLQRVFAQSIQQYLERLLNKAAQISPLSFLRMLKLAHAQTTALVDLLKIYDSGPGFAKPVESARQSSTTVTPGQGPVAIGPMLDTVMEELFVPYTEGQRYLERETKNLGDLYLLNLFAFAKYHASVSKNKASGGLFDRVVNQFTSTAAATSATTGNATATAQAAQALMKFSGLSAAAKMKENDYQPTEEEGRLSVDMAEKMLRWHAEAIGRCVELSPAGDLPKNVFTLMKTLSDAIGRSYLETALETAQARLDSRDPKQEPDYSALTIVRQVEMICHLWQQYVSVALLPLASTSIVIRRDMSVFNNQLLTRIEVLTNGVLQKVAESMTTWLSAQLTKQKKTDFKPKNDEISAMGINTEPCQACCTAMGKLLESAKENLSGMNQEIFLTDIAVTFNALLLDHLKKFPVSATGGITLAKDLKSYQETANRFGVPAIDERFEFLRLLGNLFMLPHDAIKHYVEDNALSRVDLVLLKPYLMQRSDWGTFTISGLDGGPGTPLVDGDDAEGSNANAKGLRGRLGAGRLGAMMREFEGLRIDTSELRGFTLPSMATRGFLGGPGVPPPSR